MSFLRTCKIRVYRWFRLRYLKRKMRRLTEALERDDFRGVDRIMGGKGTLDGFHFVRLSNERVSRAKRIESARILTDLGIRMPDGTDPWDMIEDV